VRAFAAFTLVFGLGFSVAAASPARATSFDLAVALAAAPTNGVIGVPAGIYRAPIIITKPVTLIADSGAVIEGEGEGTVVRIEAPDVQLCGFTIRNSGQSLSSEDCGILVKAPRASIVSNRLDHVLFGIYLKQSAGSRVVGNVVRGYDLDLPVRGDGIRLWYSDHCLIAHNDVQNSRDNIIWFSKQDVIANNHFAHDRYGLHLMYDDGLVITNNWLSENFVGAFLMYSWRIDFERNVCLNNRGVSGYGLGIKNIDDIRVRDNRILDNSVGIWMNSSPSAAEVTNRFQCNVLAYNDAGLKLDASDQGNVFTENTFMNNNQQVTRAGDGALERIEFSFQNHGNYWSDYKGYPGSNPAIGALPYRVQNLFDSLADQYPNLQLFRFSPAQEAIGLAAQAFPLIQPEVLLTDAHPLMEPPAIQAAALPAQKSSGLFGVSMALLAGMAVVIGGAGVESRRRGEKSRPQFPESPEAALPLVTVNSLSKSFGRRQVLRDLSFSIPRGRAIAFWGGNGAGKSTTIKCILGLLNFQGSIQVGGLDVIRQGKQARRLLGYVPQELSFYPDWTVQRMLDFCARIKRVAATEAQRLLAEVGLEAQTGKKVSELSGGMKQRLGLAVALLGDPQVLLLDEFTSNLDAEAREALIALLALQRSKGLTILFATHRMDEVEALADEVLFMDQGQIIRRCDVAEMKPAATPGRTLQVTLPAGQLEQAAALLGTAGHKCRRTGENLLVEVNGHGALAPLELLWERRIQIREMDLIHHGETADGSGPFFKS
jgi:nitrous oxidase accessory protein